MSRADADSHDNNCATGRIAGRGLGVLRFDSRLSGSRSTQVAFCPQGAAGFPWSGAIPRTASTSLGG